MDALTFSRATGCTLPTADHWAVVVTAAAAEYHIDTPNRLAMWLANIGHESAGFRFTREIWGPTDQQIRYERDFTQPWPVDAESSRGKEFQRNRLAWLLGNDEAGDGWRYCGRGLIQTTGKDNYRRCGIALGLDLLTHPEQLEQQQPAARSAGWFWRINDLSAVADKGDFAAVVRRINGGLTGYDDRVARFERARAALAA